MKRHAILFNNLIAAIWLSSLILTSNSHAATLSIDAHTQHQFAHHLYDSGQFRRAAEEFDRFVFFFPEDPKMRQSILSAGHSFLRAGDAVTALERLNQLTQKNNLDAIAVDAYFLKAECHLVLRDSGQAVLQLHNLITLTDDQIIKDNAYLRISWIQIEQTDWEGARRSLSRISAKGRQRHNIEILESKLALSSDIPRKNPTLAGTLSIVPGAGQLYCQRYQDALAALIVNGGLFWAAYESFDNDLNALGGLLTLTGLGFYAANIYGAVSSAHKYNRNEKHYFIDQIKQHMSINVGSNNRSNGLTGSTIALTFHYKF